MDTHQDIDQTVMAGQGGSAEVINLAEVIDAAGQQALPKVTAKRSSRKVPGPRF